MRSILWPPTPSASLEATLGSHFHVSIIDNEFSFRAGLIGMYGNMQITSSKAVLTHPQNNSIIKEWTLSTVGFKLLPQSHPQDADKVVTMITDASSTTGYGTIVMYCDRGADLIKRVHDVRQMFVQKSYGQQLKEDMESEKTEGPPKTNDDHSELGRTQSLVYTHDMNPKTPAMRLNSCPEDVPKHFKKTINDPWLDSIIKKTLTDKLGSPSETVTRKFFPNWNNIGNISEIHLDCSISFKSDCKTISEVETPLASPTKPPRDPKIVCLEYTDEEYNRKSDVKQIKELGQEKDFEEVGQLHEKLDAEVPSS